jgi:hypothetical protein
MALMAKPESVSQQHPPLFVKVDKYNDIIRIIEGLRSNILSLRDALDAMEELDREIKNGIAISQKVLDDLNATLSSLDSYFLRPRSIDEFSEIKPSGTEKAIDGYVKNVYQQVEKLKAQMSITASNK